MPYKSREDQKAWVERNKVHVREYKREWTKEYRLSHPELSRENSQIERILYPERVSARLKVCRAIANGKLSRQPCDVCGAPALAHHTDYSKPLEVRWLCPLHHKQLHMEVIL